MVHLSDAQRVSKTIKQTFLLNNRAEQLIETTLKRSSQRMNVHEFADVWHHNSHSIFYPNNPPPIQPPPTLQTLFPRANTDSNEASDQQIQVQQQQLPASLPHCNELGQILNGQPNGQLIQDQLGTNERIEQEHQINLHHHHHQQFLPSPHSIAYFRNNGATHFQMSPLSSPLMDLATHGSHAAQLLAAGFSPNFGGFNAAAPFIPFNLHAMATPRLNQSSPSSSATNTTTIFDLDQHSLTRQPGIHHTIQQSSNQPNLIAERASPNNEDLSPALQLMGSIIPTNNDAMMDTKTAILNAVEHHQRRNAIAKNSQHTEASKLEMVGNGPPLCQVCQFGPSNGLHFGASRTCAACAAQGYRKICRNCRMKRCLEIGMMPEKVQHKRHRREAVDPLINSSSSLMHRHTKVNQLQQIVSPQLESGNGGNSGLSLLSGLSQPQQRPDEFNRHHHIAANQMGALPAVHQQFGEPWTISHISGSNAILQQQNYASKML